MVILYLNQNESKAEGVPMSVDTDSLVTFIIIWGIPIFMVVRGYMKMDKGDKKSAMNDFRSRRFIITFGFLVLGTFFAHVGKLLSINTIQVIGIVLLIVGGISTTLDIWKKSKIKSMITVFLVTFVVFLNI